MAAVRFYWPDLVHPVLHTPTAKALALYAVRGRCARHRPECPSDCCPAHVSCGGCRRISGCYGAGGLWRDHLYRRPGRFLIPAGIRRTVSGHFAGRPDRQCLHSPDRGHEGQRRTGCHSYPGLNPVELLVVPRVLAMMVSLPVLTFVGMMAGMVGGAVVCALALDIPPSQFMAIVERDIALKHFLVGIGKAPVFAFLIAVIGCLEGFKVSGSAQSVGEHTTSSVVQSIFMVILLDSVAALFFMEMGW